MLTRLLPLLLLFACTKMNWQPSHTSTIRIAGSDTMYLLGKRWAEAYMRSHPNVSIYVEAGGTAEGFKQLADEKIDVAMASRVIQSKEASRLAKRFKAIGLSYLVAKDALSVYVNKANPVSNLSQQQLRAIFSGAINSWKSISGKDTTIQVVIRPPNSGTHLYFKRHVLSNSEYRGDAIVRPTTSAVVEFVEANRNAIGYGGISYGDTVKHCTIDKVAPNLENVQNDRYPLTRYLYLYTVNNPRGTLKEFIDWVIGDRGQRIVADVGYIPIWQTEPW